MLILTNCIFKRHFAISISIIYSQNEISSLLYTNSPLLQAFDFALLRINSDSWIILLLRLVFISCNKCLFAQTIRKGEGEYNLTQLPILFTCWVVKVRIKLSYYLETFTKKENVATK